MIEVLYRGFDGLDVAFQGALPRDLVAMLEDAKSQAQEQRQPVLLKFNTVRFHVAETGAPNGYAFRCDTGPDGAVWFFKRGMSRADWNIRVSVKSMALALYGLGGVRARLAHFLRCVDANAGSESIGRVDYAVDVLAPGFELAPERFVMHSHTNFKGHPDPEEFHVGGKPGRYSSVTVGGMPRRQVIVYDKRGEVIQKQKVHWWEIWNSARRTEGRPELDPADRSSRVWRVELRAGKEHLKEGWAIRTWADLDSKIGDLFRAAVASVRYAEPSRDGNRSRWPNHPVWDVVGDVLAGDLLEMTTGVDPNRVKIVIRKHLRERLMKQIVGTSASLSVALGMDAEARDGLPDALKSTLENFMRIEAAAFDEKLSRAAERYCFID
jgi:hypothetical protein